MKAELQNLLRLNFARNNVLTKFCYERFVIFSDHMNSCNSPCTSTAQDTVSKEPDGKKIVKT